MTTPVGGGSNSDALGRVSQQMAPKLAELKEKAQGQDDLLGISIFGLGIPNEMFGYDFRMPSQKAAQAAPFEYAAKMHDLLKMLKDVQGATADAADPRNTNSTVEKAPVVTLPPELS